MGLVATTSPPPPLAAKPPLLPPPPFKPYTLDGAFDALNLGRWFPQQTQQQWQNNGGTPSSPPPPPVPNRNLYASPLQQLPAPYGVSSPAPGPSPYTQYPTHKPTLPPPPSSSPRSDRVSSPLLPFCLRFLACLSQGSMRIGEFLGTESYPPCRQSVPPQPLLGQSAPPQPPSGQGVPPQPWGAQPPPLGQSVPGPRLPTMADLDLRRQRPAAVSPVQSPPQLPQQLQQQQQQEGYGRRPQLCSIRRRCEIRMLTLRCIVLWLRGGAGRGSRVRIIR